MSSTTEQLKIAHRVSCHNKDQLMAVTQVGCFFCLKRFPPKRIKEWIDYERTAVCPYCDVDSVIPYNDPKFLKQMQEAWFETDVEPFELT